MTQLRTSRLEVDQVVPGFLLPALDGREIGPPQYKQRANLVIAYLDFDRCGECVDLVKSFAAKYETYRELETEILLVTPQPMAEIRGKLGPMGLPFPVLSDQGDTMARSYFGDQEQRPAAAVLITDRYGALRTEMLAESAEQLPAEVTILDWLGLIETECPECGH